MSFELVDYRHPRVGFSLPLPPDWEQRTDLLGRCDPRRVPVGISELDLGPVTVDLFEGDGYITPRSAPFYKRLQNKHWQAKAYKGGIRNKWLKSVSTAPARAVR